MQLLKQLEIDLEHCSRTVGLGRLTAEIVGEGVAFPEEANSFPYRAHGDRAPWLQPPGRDAALERSARELLHEFGAGGIASQIRVTWNSRMRSGAGRADYRRKLISLNFRLREHGAGEIDRTFRHELAHLLAQFRAGRRRISPHGKEWRKACHELGIGDEERCHHLPFPMAARIRRFLYKCPNCRRDFPRVRRVRRAIACLACCRAHNRGEFHQRFRLQLVAPATSGNLTAEVAEGAEKTKT